MATMTEALRLTRSGDLAGAAALLGAGVPAGLGAGAPAGLGTVPPAMPGRAPGLLSHRGRQGVLGYALHVPPGGAAGRPLLVMLHGCTQTPEDFARGTAMNALADEHRVTVAWPAQGRDRNPNGCWNWFRPGDQARDRGEPGLVAGLTRELVAEHRADPARVFVAGLSAGGAAAAVLGNAYPDLYAAIGIHSGIACGAAHDVPSALAAMRQGSGAGVKPQRFVPVISIHGDRDATVAEVNARQIVAAAAAASGVALTTTRETGRSAGGRAFTRALSRDPAGALLIEQWTVAGAGHAWSGGDAAGSYTDPAGPDASRAMLRFFLER